MDQAVKKFLSSQPENRQDIMTEIHQVILEQDKTVTPVIEPMMGKEMIVYKAGGSMKYALSGVIKHISLHVLPIYGSKELYSKYQQRLPKTSFQKGCINFNHPDEMPLSIVADLFRECAKIDLQKIREEYLKSKKQAAKNKNQKLK